MREGSGERGGVGLGFTREMTGWRWWWWSGHVLFGELWVGDFELGDSGISIRV